MDSHMFIYFDPTRPDKFGSTFSSQDLTDQEIDAIFNLAKITGRKSMNCISGNGRKFYTIPLVDGKFDKFA